MLYSPVLRHTFNNSIYSLILSYQRTPSPALILLAHTTVVRRPGNTGNCTNRGAKAENSTLKTQNTLNQPTSTHPSKREINKSIHQFTSKQTVN